MKKLTYIKTVFVLSICGTLFAGYLSALKFFTETCAFNESCPFFLGYPACYYGFFMFFLLFIFSLFALIKKNKILKIRKALQIISFAGVLFAGYFTVIEILPTFKATFLGLSTCAYGLLFFVVIFIISLIKIKSDII